MEYGNKAFGYNKNGYITTVVEGADTTRYVYDNLGNLTQVLLPDGSVLDYITDANNRRIAKKLDGNVIKKWLYSGELTPIAELDSLGNIISRFVYGTKANIPDYYVKNDSTYKIVSDHLGSARLVVNVATGEIKQQINYDEFGNVLFNSGESLTPFGYAGGLSDEQTNLIRFGARDYSAEIGRWIAKDPMFFDAGGYNLYSYVVNEPINIIDNNGKIPSGLIQNALLGLVTATVTNFSTQYLVNGGKIDIGELVTQALVGVGTGATFGQLSSKLIQPTKNTGAIFTNSMFGFTGGLAGGTFAYIADAAYRGKLDPNSIVPMLGGLAGMCSGLVMSSNDPDAIIMGMNVLLQATIQVGLQVFKYKNDRMLRLYN